MTPEEKKKEYDRRYYEKNKERIIARSKLYAEENRERVNEYQRQYSKNNRERRNESQKRYRERHPERCKEANRRYIDKYPERTVERHRKYRERAETKEYMTNWHIEASLNRVTSVTLNTIPEELIAARKELLLLRRELRRSK